MIYAEKTATKP